MSLIEIDGTISFEAEGGAAPFAIIWSTGEPAQTITPTETGNYSLTIVDANGCTLSESLFLIVFPDELVANIEHDGDGQLTAVVAGGTPPYFYSWSTGENTPQITVTNDGVYFLTVEDIFGIEVTAEINVVL